MNTEQLEDPLGPILDDLVIGMREDWSVFRSRKDTKGQTHDYPLRDHADLDRVLRDANNPVNLATVVLRLRERMPEFLIEFAPDGRGCVEYILRKEIPQPVKTRRGNVMRAGHPLLATGALQVA